MGYTILRPEQERRIRGVLFDMDGLVLDTEKLYSRFWMEACHFYDLPMTVEQSLRMRAANSRVGQANLWEFFGEKADYQQIRAKRIELMDTYIEENGVELRPGVVELLDYLEEVHLPAAIASSSPMERIRKHLASVGLVHRFARLCSGYEVPTGKPAPDIYLHAADALGLKAEDCMALEDAPLGILSAHRAGCLSVMVPDQDQPTQNTLTLLYAKADSLTDVIDLLRRCR